MIVKYNKKDGFTMAEMMIAIAVFSLLMASAFSLFSYANKSFEVGSWRLSTQKQMQTFLLRFKETVEKANHPYEITTEAEGKRVATAPILIYTPFYNKLASSTNNIIMCGSISSPCFTISAELGGGSRTGIWKGFALQCFNKNLKFYQSGDWNNLEPALPAAVGTADPTKFELGNKSGDFSIELKNVEVLGLQVQNATGSTDLNHEILITLTVKSVHEKNRNSTVTESITAKVSDRLLNSNEIRAQDLAVTTK